MKLKTLTLVDTFEFTKWAQEKYGMSNNEWHKKIWSDSLDGNGMCRYLEHGNSYVTFTKFEKPDNLLEEHINAFLDDFPELEGKVSFIFTN